LSGFRYEQKPLHQIQKSVQQPVTGFFIVRISFQLKKYLTESDAGHLNYNKNQFQNNNINPTNLRNHKKILIFFYLLKAPVIQAFKGISKNYNVFVLCKKKNILKNNLCISSDILYIWSMILNFELES